MSATAAITTDAGDIRTELRDLLLKVTEFRGKTYIVLASPDILEESSPAIREYVASLSAEEASLRAKMEEIVKRVAEAALPALQPLITKIAETLDEASERVFLGRFSIYLFDPFISLESNCTKVPQALDYWESTRLGIFADERPKNEAIAFVLRTREAIVAARTTAIAHKICFSDRQGQRLETARLQIAFLLEELRKRGYVPPRPGDSEPEPCPSFYLNFDVAKLQMLFKKELEDSSADKSEILTKIGAALGAARLLSLRVNVGEKLPALGDAAKAKDVLEGYRSALASALEELPDFKPMCIKLWV